MQERVNEIRTFLSHGDISLATRRMLDLAFDTGDSNVNAAKHRLEQKAPE
jgi:hypothetical protein